MFFNYIELNLQVLLAVDLAIFFHPSTCRDVTENRSKTAVNLVLGIHLKILNIYKKIK
jgi:hypothetical protein